MAAFRFLKFFKEERNNHNEMQLVDPAPPTYKGFRALKMKFFSSPLHISLHAERNLLLCIALCPYDNDHPIYFDALKAVYKYLSGDDSECPRYGPHWERIGFQGNDPATDFRSTGMLSLLQLLEFTESQDYGKLLLEIFAGSHDEEHKYPFCVLAINITSLCMEILRSNLLSSYIHSKKRSRYQEDTVFEVMNELYKACFLHYHEIWSKGNFTIIESGRVWKEVQEYCLLHPKKLIHHLHHYQQRHFHHASKPSSSASSIPQANNL